jgi:hypothetical protein
MKSIPTGLVPAFENSTDVLLDEWTSELDFLEEELKFFCKVMDNYRLNGDLVVTETFEPLKLDIIALETQRNDLKAELEKRKKDVRHLKQNKDPKGGQWRVKEYDNRLQSDFYSLLRNMRFLKEKFFRITEEL